MVTHPVHYFIMIQMLELNFSTIIVWMVMHIVICLYYERLDGVTPEDVYLPFIKMSVKITIEEQLGIEGRRATHGVKRGP